MMCESTIRLKRVETVADMDRRHTRVASQSLESYQILRVDLGVVENNEYRRIARVVDRRVILSTARLGRRYDHRLGALGEVAGQREALVDVLEAVRIGRSVGRTGRVEEVAGEVDATTVHCSYKHTNIHV